MLLSDIEKIFVCIKKKKLLLIMAFDSIDVYNKS